MKRPAGAGRDNLCGMTSLMIALLLKPFAALVLFGLICLPVRLLVQRMPESRVKRLLLFRVKDRICS